MSTSTTNAPAFLRVGQHVARNAVARAVARQRIAQATRDFAVRMYLLPDGVQVQADADAAAHVLAVALAVCEQTGQLQTPDARVMQGGMCTLVDLARRRWLWREADAVPIDQALQRALWVYQQATAHQVQQAYIRIAATEAAA